MASSREKLRAMSKKNLEDQTMVTNQPTLVSSVVNQLNNERPVEEKANVASDVINKPVTEEVEGIIEGSNSITVTEGSNEATDGSESATATSVTEASDGTTKVSEDATVAENATDVIKGYESVTKGSEDEKYAGREVTVTLLLSDEANEFLTYKAIDLRIPVKKYFKELMINEIENGILVEDGLTKTYRKVQHDTIKKSVPVNEDLKESIKEAAIKYHMRYTAFMAYIIDKARLSEKTVAL